MIDPDVRPVDPDSGDDLAQLLLLEREARAALLAGAADLDQHDVHAFAHEHAADAANIFEALLEEHQVHLLGLRIGVLLLEPLEGFDLQPILPG